MSAAGESAAAHPLETFCFEHDELFLVPAEELSSAGLSARFAAVLGARGVASAEWIRRFDEAFRLYWRRAAELSARDPRRWLPPRAQNVCVALDGARARPFYAPLGRASSLVEHAAFEPGRGSIELAAFQLLHAERVGLLGRILPALVHDLGYWLARGPEERRDFRAGCRRSGAPAWRALGEALEWIPACAHRTLKPPAGIEAAREVDGSGFLVPERCAADLERLLAAWRAAAEERARAYFAAHAASGPRDAGELADWLRAERPFVLVAGARGAILWDPEAPERTDELERALAGISAAAAASVRADLAVVSARSRAFLDALVEPGALPRPGPEIDQDGLAYVHRERRLVAYGVLEPGMHRLRAPAPPFERWMLGARTVHEWGHLAVDAGCVPVPEARRQEFARTRAELAVLLDALAAEAPSALRAHAAAHVAALERAGGVGHALVAFLLGRMPDYQANLLAQPFLTPEERETYVRNNVRPLVGEVPSAQLFVALARHAFEAQYLAFAAVAEPRAYLLATTWFGEQFLARGVLSEARLDELLGLVARLCRCHEVDASRFREARPAS